MIWPIKDRVNFGTPHQEVLDTFEAIESGNIAESVNHMATHEQINILQPAMYDDAHFASLIWGTHASDKLSVVTGLLSGVPEGIQLTLASQCRVSDERSVSFSSNPLSNLANKNQRMEFVLRAAAQFNNLLKYPASRSQLEKSIANIADGTGVRP